MEKFIPNAFPNQKNTPLAPLSDQTGSPGTPRAAFADQPLKSDECLKEFNQFCRQIMKLSEEVEKEVMAEVREKVDRSPSPQKRMQILQK